MPRTAIAGLFGSYMFRFLRHCQTDSQSVFIILYSFQQCASDPVSMSEDRVGEGRPGPLFCLPAMELLQQEAVGQGWENWQPVHPGVKLWSQTERFWGGASVFLAVLVWNIMPGVELLDRRAGRRGRGACPCLKCHSLLLFLPRFSRFSWMNVSSSAVCP